MDKQPKPDTILVSVRLTQGAKAHLDALCASQAIPVTPTAGALHFLLKGMDYRETPPAKETPAAKAAEKKK